MHMLFLCCSLRLCLNCTYWTFVGRNQSKCGGIQCRFSGKDCGCSRVINFKLDPSMESSSFFALCALDYKFGPIKRGCYTNLDVTVGMDCGTQPHYSSSRDLLSNENLCLEGCMIHTSH